MNLPWYWLFAVGSVCGCGTLTPHGTMVSVYRTSLDALPAERRMPDGCRLLSTTPPVSMAEIDLEGQKDPFRSERNETGAAGGNALLVLTRMTMGRRDPECPTASPITDCPATVGAWFRVVFESYACTPDALTQLAKAPPVALAPGREPLHR
jgi:hypothetical protein